MNVGIRLLNIPYVRGVGLFSARSAIGVLRPCVIDIERG